MFINEKGAVNAKLEEALANFDVAAAEAAVLNNPELNA